MLNIPPQLALPLNRTLFGSKDKASQLHFDFGHYLILTKYQQCVNEKNKKRSKHGKGATKFNEEVYAKIEDEVFQKEAELQFTFPINRDEQTSRWTLNGEMSTVGLVMVINKDNIQKVIQQLVELLE